MTRNELLRQLAIHFEFQASSGVDFIPPGSKPQERLLQQEHKATVNAAKPLTTEDKTREFEEFKKNVLACTRCALCKGRTQVVFGSGNLSSTVMFVGEAPGYEEDMKGEPFVGRAGQLLESTMAKLGIKRTDVYIANIIKCRPPENRKPAFEEIVACIPYLLKQIQYIHPKVICALGSVAVNSLLSHQYSITQIRGRFFDYNNMRIFATYHPAYVLRNMKELGTFEKDLRAVLKEVGLI